PTGETTVSVLIDPSKFRNTPIADIPDANLGPVREQVASIAETVLPLGQKQPGEAIKAEDFNLMATSIREMALAVAELTRLVSPVGHNHPELEAKFDEKAGDPDFAASAGVKDLSQSADLLKAQRATSYDTELEHHLKVVRSFGGGGLKVFGGGGR